MLKEGICIGGHRVRVYLSHLRKPRINEGKFISKIAITCFIAFYTKTIRSGIYKKQNTRMSCVLHSRHGEVIAVRHNRTAAACFLIA